MSLGRRKNGAIHGRRDLSHQDAFPAGVDHGISHIIGIGRNSRDADLAVGGQPARCSHRLELHGRFRFHPKQSVGPDASSQDDD